jgi:cytochrome c oxidase assembly protein subunit 15
MTDARTVRRLAYVALVVAVLHLIFGAIVRISGSGMGCGDHWPRCYGHWFPPLDRPDLIIEVSHRYLATIVGLAALALVIAAFRARRRPGVGGADGALRPAVGALLAIIAEALLGAYTVKRGNTPFATVAHFLGAMMVLGLLAMTAIRTGGLGGTRVLGERGSRKTMRGATAAAGLALFAVVMGGVTAKYPGASVGCRSFPHCDGNPGVSASARAIQVTHRTVAFLLSLHLIGMVMMLRKRKATESPVVVRAATIALGMVVLQLLVAGAMIGMRLPAVLRSVHEAVGVGIWLATFTFAYLARRASAQSSAIV